MRRPTCFLGPRVGLATIYIIGSQFLTTALVAKIKTIELVRMGQTIMKVRNAPPLQEGDIMVAMRSCGLCGSDLEKIKGEYVAVGSILGHEATGVVVEVKGDSEFSVGDRVFPHHHVPCYTCRLCKNGSETMCPYYRRFQLDPGGFSDYFRVDSWIVRHGGVLRLPSSMTFDEGSFIEPLGCCIRSVRRLGVSPGSSVLVVGAGPMGLLEIQLLRQLGCSQVFASEISQARLKRAEELGADLVFDPSHDDVAAEVHKCTNGEGVDFALVASGNPRALSQALNSVRRGGKVGLIGVMRKGSSLDYDVSRFVTEEVSIVSSNGATEEDTRSAMDLIHSGKIAVASLVTHHFSLERFDEAVKVAEDASAIKCIITP